MNKVTWKSFADAGFKASESADGTPLPEESDLNQVSEGDVAGAIADLFEPGSSTSGEAASPWDLTIGGTNSAPGTKIDPTTGEIVDDPTTNPYPAPTIEEVESKAKETGATLKLSDYDTLRSYYEKAKASYKTELEQLNAAIEVDGITNENKTLNGQLIALATEAINKIDYSLSRIEEIKNELSTLYDEEYLVFQNIAKGENDDKAVIKAFNEGLSQERSDAVLKLLAADKNGDGWIGDPSTGVRIIQGTSKGNVLWDANAQKFVNRLSSSGAPVTDKWFDTTSEWNVSRKGVTKADDKYGNEDVMFRIDEGYNSMTTTDPFDKNTLDAQMEIGIPDYIVVKADEEGNPITKSDDDGEIRYKPATLTQAADGSITQSIPSNTTKYAQVKVCSVEVESVNIKGDSFDDKSSIGYDQIVKFLDAHNQIICKFRYTGAGNDPTATTYNAASDFGLALNGYKPESNGTRQRTEPIHIDATAMRSTNTTAVVSEEQFIDAFQRTVGGEGLAAELDKMSGVNAKLAFQETANQFVKADSTSPLLGLGDGTSLQQGTGLMAIGVCGYIEGSEHAGNLIFLEDPKSLDLTREARKGKDEDKNALYQSVVEGNGNANEMTEGNYSYNAVFSAGSGDFYAKDMTLAWRESKDKKATSAVAMRDFMGTPTPKPDGVPNQGNTVNDYESKQVRVFAYLGGSGDKFIDNPSDTDTVGATTDTIKDKPDDFFYTQGSGYYSNPFKNSGDTIGDRDADSALGGDGDTKGVIAPSKMIDFGRDIMDAIEDMDADAEDPYLDLDYSTLGGDFYDSAKKSNDIFFGAITDTFGFKNDKMDEGEEDDKASDLENISEVNNGY